VVTLSVTSQELYTPVISHLFYVSVALDVFGSVLQALIDSGSAINIIHDAIVAFLKIPVRPCVGPKVTLADGKTSLYCNSSVVLSYSTRVMPVLKHGCMAILLFYIFTN
jgi:hypothetical protein